MSCEVLEGDAWFPGEILQWRRDPDGWCALVRWREGPLQRQSWRSASVLRPR